MKKVEVLTAQDQKIRATACLQCLHRMRYSLSTVFCSVSTVNLQSLKQLHLCEMLKLIGFSKDKRYCYAKLGVRSCDESDRERNKKLDRVSLFVQKFGKPKISERLNSSTAIQIANLKVIEFY